MKLSHKITIILGGIVFLYFLPQLVLIVFFSPNVYSSVENLPTIEYGIVFGAKVYDNGELSPIAKQRIEVALELYRQQKIKKLFISGTNSSNKEVEVLAAYAARNGVPKENILVDNNGIDTNDTCKHFVALDAEEAYLVTQKFHLPRALYMCQRAGIKGGGIAANKLFLISSDDNLLSVYAIRAERFLRESGLTWLYLLGVYDKISNQAEINVAPSILRIQNPRYLQIQG